MSRGFIVLTTVVLAGALLFFQPTSQVCAQAKKKWKYTGNEGCKCHLSPGCFEGEEYKKIKHSEAFKRLQTPEEQKDPNCLKCHATAYGEKIKNPKLTFLEDVACEACHGAGEGYAEVKNNYEGKGKEAFNELLKKDQMTARKVQYDSGLIVAGINNAEGTVKAQCLNCHWEKEDAKDKCPKVGVDEKTGKPKVFVFDEAFKKDDHRDQDEIDDILAKMSAGDKAKWKGYVEKDPILNSPIKPEAKEAKKKAKKG